MKVFKFGIIFIMVSFTLSFMIQESWQIEVVSSEKPGFQTLKNSEYGFSFDYPREWNFDERKISDPVAVYSIVFSGSDTVYFEVAVWRQSDYELNTVGTDYLNYMIDFEEDQCDNSIAYTNEECSNYRLERAEIVKINGMDAYQIKHSMIDSKGHFTEIVTDFKSPNYAVTIFANANTDEFYKHENDFDIAINSFVLENVDMVGVIIIPLAIAVVVGIAVVLIIRWARKKKKVSSKVLHPSEELPPSNKAQAAKTQDDTQFWVCPNCGRDTQAKDGRQYCPSCKIYLSI